MKKKNSSAFTLIELLVVISIIAILASLAVPAITGALTKGQMTGTMNNARQFYLAGFQMATDGSANSDPNYSWPGDYQAAAAGGGAGGSGAVDTLEAYCNKLVQNDYLKPGDLQKILNAPGANCTVTSNAAGGVTSVQLAGSSGLKVYKVKEVDASNTIFGVSANFTYNTALSPTAVPYGDKGFVVMRKGGDASIFRKNQAVMANYGGDITKYGNAVGVLTGAQTTESSGMVLTNPQ